MSRSQSTIERIRNSQNTTPTLHRSRSGGTYIDIQIRGREKEGERRRRLVINAGLVKQKKNKTKNQQRVARKTKANGASIHPFIHPWRVWGREEKRSLSLSHSLSPLFRCHRNIPRCQKSLRFLAPPPSRGT